MATTSAIKSGRTYVEMFLDSTKLDRGLKMAQTKIQDFGAGMQKLGQKLAGAGTLALIPFAMSAKVFADYDDAIRTVKAVTQSSGEDFDMLNKKAKHLGATTSFTATEVAGLMAELGRAGFNAQQIDGMTAAVLNLSRATGTEAAMAAGIMSATLRQYGLGAADAANVSDYLTAAANKSFNTLETLGEALGYAGGVAADFGLSVEETLAVLGILGNFNIQGSAAGTTFRRMLLLSGSESAKLKELFNVEAVDSLGKLRSPIDILDEISKSMQGLGSAQKAAKLNEFFGLLGVTGASALAKSGDSARQLLDEIRNTSGIASETALEMDGGLGGSLRILMSSIEGIAIAVGGAIAPTLSGWADSLSEVAGWITALSNENQDFLVGVMGTAAGITAAGVAFMGIGGILAITGIAIGGIITLFASLSAAIAFLLTPVGIVVGALAAFAASLAYASIESGHAKGMLTDLAGSFSDAFATIGQAIKNGQIEEAFQMLWNRIQLKWKSGIVSLKEMWNEFQKSLLQNGAIDFAGVSRALTIDTSGDRREIEQLELNYNAMSAAVAAGTIEAEKSKTVSPLAAVAVAGGSRNVGEMSRKQTESLGTFSALTERIFNNPNQGELITIENNTAATAEGVQEVRRSLDRLGRNSVVWGA